MKYLLIILLFISQIAKATNYYIKNSGSNAAAGTSDAAAWQTISKINSFTFASGDSILFKRGDIWLGSVVVPRNDLNFSAYGTGARPIITGFVSLAGWSAVGGGLYKTTVVAPNDVRVVTVNGTPVEWGRTPNKNLGTASYYYAEAVNNSGTHTFTDNQQTGTPSRTGNRGMIVGQTWARGEFICSAHSGSVFTYRVGRQGLINTGNYFQYGKVGSGVVWMGNIIDCDQQYEWAYDSIDNALNMFFGATDPTTVTVKVGTLETLFDCGSHSGISIDNIAFEGAEVAIYNRNGSGGTSITNCSFDKIAARCVLMSNLGDIAINDNTVSYCYSTPFRGPTNNTSTASIQRNLIDSTNAPFETMFYNGEEYDGNAIVCGMSNAVIAHNTLKRSAYQGIWFTGSNVRVDTNNISNWGAWSNDCGATYTHALTGRGSFTVHTNRTVTGNYAHDATAWRYGLNNSLASASVKGYYNDDQSHNVTYTRNTTYNVDISTSNNLTANVIHRGNTYISRRGLNFSRKSYSQITNFQFAGNVVSTIGTSDIAYYYLNDSLPDSNIPAAIAGHGIVVDSNYLTAAPFGTETYTTDEPLTNYKQTLYNSIGTWRTATGLSAHDVVFPYLPFSETGRKVVENWTLATVVSPLTGIWKDYLGNTYNGSITLPPKTVKLIYYSEAIVPTLPGAGVTVPWRAAN